MNEPGRHFPEGETDRPDDLSNDDRKFDRELSSLCRILEVWRNESRSFENPPDKSRFNWYAGVGSLSAYIASWLSLSLIRSFEKSGDLAELMIVLGVFFPLVGLSVFLMIRASGLATKAFWQELCDLFTRRELSFRGSPQVSVVRPKFVRKSMFYSSSRIDCGT